MRFTELFFGGLLVAASGILLGCNPANQRQVDSPNDSPDARIDVHVDGRPGRVDVDVDDGRVDVDATTDPAPKGPVRKLIEGGGVDVEVEPGDVDVEVIPKPVAR